MMDRRTLLFSGATAGVAGGALLLHGRAHAKAETFPLTLTPEQWRKRLTPAQFEILRQQGTEPPFTSPLLNEHRRGTFACAGCGLPLYSSATKFDSGTGWPSFYAPLPRAVATQKDFSMIVPRDEVHCTRCGGHLGHVFDDGPKPTGLRYCMDGLALKFQPA